MRSQATSESSLLRKEHTQLTRETPVGGNYLDTHDDGGDAGDGHAAPWGRLRQVIYI